MFGRPTEYRTIRHINEYYGSLASLRNIRDKRAKVSIAVIDDNSFKPLMNLQSVGYSIQEVGDIKRIDQVKDFPLVLCDLMGVGSSLGGDAQGAEIIKEIKLNYPNTLVVAYTGAGFQSREVKHAKEAADEILRKDADIAEWREILDPLVQSALNPVEIWHRFRLQLVKQGADTFFILKLEDAYVRSLEKKDTAFRKMLDVVDQDSANAKWRSMIVYFVASSIFKAIMS